MSEEAGRFLARWAKRKAAARNRGRPAEAPGGDEDATAAARTPAVGETPSPDAAPEGDVPAAEARNLAEEQGEGSEAALPDVETLGSGSDFRPFMAEGVPVEVKNKALRKLWASNPLYNHIDMLDDYCEDYTDAACAVPGVKTAYQVGRGFVKELSRDEAPQAPAERAPESPDDPTSGDEVARDMAARDKTSEDEVARGETADDMCDPDATNGTSFATVGDVGVTKG